MKEYPTGTVTFVFTDVVDSSRLWEEQPEAMRHAMATHDEVMKDLIAANSGVMVKQTGDGAFAVFASVFDAIAAAMAFRTAFAAESSRYASALAVRIGVHTGEAGLRDGDYFGSSVNRAARVMSLAKGGQVLVSLATKELVRDRLPSGMVLRDVGKRDLKGLSRPEQIFELAAAEGQGDRAPTRLANASTPIPDGGHTRRAAWIAVLPFENMSGDPEQDYFADGVADDVITGLAAWGTLRVIARTSSFHYRGSGASIDQIADELGVGYLLEGSVRRAGQRVRVTAQLIETAGQHHIWADRYDADMADIFDVQDRITRSIVAAIDPAIRLAETEPQLRVPTENLDAWDHVQLGRSESYKYKKSADAAAIRHFTAALELDPAYSVARSSLAFVHFMDGWLNFVDKPAASFDLALQEATKAIDLDERDAMAHAILAFVNLGMGQLGAMAASAGRALELNASLPQAYLAAGIAKTYDGEPDDGCRLIGEAIALAPHDPSVNFSYGARAVGHFVAGRYDDAVGDARTAIHLKYGYVMARVLLASALAHLEDLPTARSQLRDLLQVKPGFTPALLHSYPFSKESDRDRIIEGLYLAGLPRDA